MAPRDRVGDEGGASIELFAQGSSSVSPGVTTLRGGSSSISPGVTTLRGGVSSISPGVTTLRGPSSISSGLAAQWSQNFAELRFNTEHLGQFLSRGDSGFEDRTDISLIAFTVFRWTLESHPTRRGAINNKRLQTFCPRFLLEWLLAANQCLVGDC